MTRSYSRHSLFARAARISWAASALAVLVIAAPALAAPINYGNFGGATVDYLQVTEDANSPGDSPPLFGPPTVTGDSIDFDPVGFNAASAGGGADLTDGQLKFTVMAKPGKAINNLKFAEAGDVTLLGATFNDLTFASVSTHMFVDITEVDGAPISVVSVNATMPFSPSGGTYGLLSDGGGNPIFTTTWTGSTSLDINSILTANGIPFRNGATKIDVNLDNTLAALSQLGTSALIAKKNASGIVITVNVPEPGACLLATLGLAFAGLKRRN